MDRKKAKGLLPIIEAYAKGEDVIVQERYKDSPWRDFDENWMIEHDEYQYRIKPEPREFWIDPDDYEVWLDQDTPPVPHAIKVREVLE